MVRSATVSLVRSKDDDLQARKPSGKSIIATTEPFLFETRFAAQSDISVFIFDNATDTVRTISRLDASLRYVFADFRQLSDRWTGQRLLKHIRAIDSLAHVKVYILAEKWEHHQEEWSMKWGGSGFIKRDPEHVARVILGEASSKPFLLTHKIEQIEKVFGEFAGPMRSIIIQDARIYLDRGLTDSEYIELLGAKLLIPERRAKFVREATKTLIHEPPSTDQPNETDLSWQDDVNAIFKTFAGALGARILIEQTREHLDASGEYSKDVYVVELAKKLSTPSRREDFMKMLRQQNLLR